MPADISEYCCEALKKEPFKRYVKETGRQPFIGITQDESFRRENQYNHTGCNVYDGHTIKSQPMGFWPKNEVIQYAVEQRIPICSVYGTPYQDKKGNWYFTGEQRTGCCVCGFGCHLEPVPNRLQRLRTSDNDKHRRMCEGCLQIKNHGMTSRPEITAMLSLSIQRHICPDNDPRIYWAREVTFDYATMNAVRVDFMKFKPVNNTVSGIEKGDFYCYEVKSSVEDFHSKNGHNFLGDYNYYVMPEEVYEQIKKEIPYQIGVYVPDRMNYRGEWYDLKAIKKAKRKDRSRPVSEMLLMMFRSAARDRTTGK